MRLALISLLMIPLAGGCETKADIEQSIETCITVCESKNSYGDRCLDWSSAEDDDPCEDWCPRRTESLYDSGCEEEWDVYNQCYLRLNLENMECEDGVYWSDIRVNCEEEESVLGSCES